VDFEPQWDVLYPVAQAGQEEDSFYLLVGVLGATVLPQAVMAFVSSIETFCLAYLAE
jgi:hypothetical protein